MISWGTKYDNMGEYTHIKEEECKVCSKLSKHHYIGEQAQFTFFGMSLAPTSKVYYKICPNCKSRLKVKHGDPALSYVEEAIPTKMKFKYFWGWIIILPVIIAIVIFFVEINKNK